MQAWQFQPIANGYAWNLQSIEKGHLCRVILWNSHDSGWRASGLVVDGQGSAKGQFDSRGSSLTGMESCLEWAWHFTRSHGLPEFNLGEARAQLLGQAARLS